MVVQLTGIAATNVMNGPGDRLEANTVVAHRYRVIRYLGDRGFGQIYQAEDTATETDVVVMRLDREFSHPRVRESFFETRGDAQVQDPRVVDLTDYGEDLDGRLFLVMPWVEDAVSLDALVARHGALPWSRTKAKKAFDWKTVKKQLERSGVTLLSACLDEVPGVYKDIHQVMDDQRDLVSVVGRFDPKIVKMAPAGERPED